MQEKNKIYNIHAKEPTPPQPKPYGWQTPISNSRGQQPKLNISLTCLRRNLRDGATCSTHRRASASLQTRLGNPSQTCFHTKQAARSQRVSRADLPLSVLWHNRQTEACLVLRPKPRNRRSDFEAQITKPKLLVLRPKPRNPPPPWFWGSSKKSTTGFKAKLGETVATGFEAKPMKIVTAGFKGQTARNRRSRFWGQTTRNRHHRFWGQTGENRLSGFEAKPLTNRRHRFWGPNRWETIRVVLRPNHSQTVDLGFKAQPRNPRSSSPCAPCRPHTMPPDLSTAQPPSTQPVRPSPVLCTRSPTPATILIAARHAAPATYTPRDKQTRFSKWNKDKRKTKQTIPDSNSNLAK
jgi:hypothetical protein